MLMNKIKVLLNNPYRLFTGLASKGLLNWMPDEPYLKLIYRARTGRKLNLKDPKRLTEKMQWLKLNDHNPLYSELVDKYAVRKRIAAAIGEKYLIPLVGGPWDCFEDIDFDNLPNQFVLKCTHDSGGLVICRDKGKLDLEKAKVKIQRSLKHNYYHSGREWPYKNVQPRIIAESYMEDPGCGYLTDYKIFCFHGVPRIVLTVRGGHEDESKTVRRMYNEDWELYPVGIHDKPAETIPEPRPAQLENMLELARKLSAGFKHLRVDFYVVSDRIYFGELTFYHMSGMEHFDPDDYDRIFGQFLDLNK